MSLDNEVTLLELINQSNNSANLAMPSDTQITLELGASGTLYTAPADGYVHLVGYPNTIGHFFNMGPKEIFNGTGWSDILSAARYQVTGAPCIVWIPVHKGQQYWVYYDSMKTLVKFAFIYAEGSVPNS